MIKLSYRVVCITWDLQLSGKASQASLGGVQSSLAGTLERHNRQHPLIIIFDIIIVVISFVYVVSSKCFPTSIVTFYFVNFIDTFNFGVF